jgi:hypothetical protein
MVLLLIFFQVHSAVATTYDIFHSYYTKGPFCSVIGGACAADPDFDGGFFQNPAVLTATGAQVDFDFDIETGVPLEPGVTSSESDRQDSVMGAIAAASDSLASGFSITRFDTTANSTIPNELTVQTQAQQTQLNIPFAYHVNAKWDVGATLILFENHNALSVQSGSPLLFQDMSQKGFSFGARIGALYHPQENIYYGSWLQSPITFHQSDQVSGMVQNQEINFVDNEDLHIPLIFAFGASWKPHDHKVTYLIQGDFIAPTPSGYLQSYNAITANLLNQSLTPKGRQWAFEPRLGLKQPFSEYWTFFAGTYYENGRTAGIGGRPHLTSGISYKIRWDLPYWDIVELMAGVDVANNFTQFLLTFR